MAIKIPQVKAYLVIQGIEIYYKKLILLPTAFLHRETAYDTIFLYVLDLLSSQHKILGLICSIQEWYMLWICFLCRGKLLLTSVGTLLNFFLSVYHIP